MVVPKPIPVIGGVERHGSRARLLAISFYLHLL